MRGNKKRIGCDFSYGDHRLIKQNRLLGDSLLVPVVGGARGRQQVQSTSGGGHAVRLEGGKLEGFQAVAPLKLQRLRRDLRHVLGHDCGCGGNDVWRAGPGRGGQGRQQGRIWDPRGVESQSVAGGSQSLGKILDVTLVRLPVRLNALRSV